MGKTQSGNLQPVFRLSLEDRHAAIDQTDALLLRKISEASSLTKAAKQAGISYRNAWDRLKAMESSLGVKLVETKVGGATGGGAKLTPEGAELLKNFRKLRKYIFNALEDRASMVQAGYKLSARNRITAKVTKVDKGPITASVKMAISSPTTLTSIISREAVDDLELKEGDEVEVIIKSTEVMVAKET